MPGGLIQIASYGSQDLTLTGNPQITFFKLVFRRYTNFGKKMVELAFDNPVNFNNTSTITVPKSGDLLSKAVLKIKLPSFNLTELNNYLITNVNLTNVQTVKLDEYFAYYDFLINFINNLKNICKKFFINNSSTSFTYIQDLSTYILSYIEQDEFIQYFNIIDYYFNNGIVNNLSINTNIYKNASLFNYNNNLFTYIYNNYNENEIDYVSFNKTINANMDILTKLNSVLYQILLDLFKQKTTIGLGWINKIAIYILDNIELTIGSNIINTFGSNYIDIYGQLNYKNTDLYNKLIGNNQNFNSTNFSQPNNYVFLPIPFWFSNNNGLALPLIALQYNTLQIKIKLKKLIDCIYFDISQNNSVADTIKAQIINVVLSKSIEIFTSNLEITMLLEYIYLDNIERKKFAQSSHEYLITQVQEIVFENVSPLSNNFELYLFHCCKELYWSAIQYKNINNLYSNNYYDKYNIDIPIHPYSNNDPNYLNYLNLLYNPYILFDPLIFINGLNPVKLNLQINSNDFYTDVSLVILNSTTNFNNTINPIINSSLLLNGVSLIDQPSNYFNYLQSYNYYNSTPSVGINTYSFSINPTELQPSGSCNLSRIPKITLNLDITSSSLDLNNIDTNVDIIKSDNLSTYSLFNYKIYVQAVNYNILRFIGGIVGVAFTY